MLYEYEPSKVAPIIFIVLFGITTAYHIFQLARRRTWYFIPFVIGGFCKFNLLLFDVRLQDLCLIASSLGLKAGVPCLHLHFKFTMPGLRRQSKELSRNH